MPQEKQTTAVQWLMDKLNSSKCWADPIQCSQLFEQAKDIERQQIEDAKIELYLFKGYDLEDSKKMASDYFERTFTQQQ